MKNKDKLFLIDKHIKSSSLQIHKIGFLSRSEANKKSEELASVLIKKCKKYKIKLTYDVSYGGHPQELRYSEFFAGLGGLQIGPCDGNLIRLLLTKKYDESNNIDYSTFLSENTYDKYLVHDYDISDMRGLIILPGSNLLSRTVDKRKLNAAVDLGAKIKPHPLTQEQDLTMLYSEYGYGIVLPSLYSGYKAMYHSNVIYSTGTSELGLYAMLLKKRVIDIGTEFKAGGYNDCFYRTVDATNQKEALNQYLNNPGSGIVFKEEQIDPYLELYQETLSFYLKNKDKIRIPPLTCHPVI